MFTISFDEYGYFEQENNDKPMFIAGFIYDDRDIPGERENEKKRIKQFFLKMTDEAGVSEGYPSALHSNSDQERDRNIVRPVKRKVDGNLSEFLSNGTVNGGQLLSEDGSERRGCYHLFAIIKSNDGKNSLLGENRDILVKDSYAANRYFHMAGSIISRVFFHNPVCDMSSSRVILDIPTRRTGNNLPIDEKKEFASFFTALTDSNTENSGEFYIVANKDIYRTLLAQEMMDLGNNTVRLERMDVRPIKYDPSASDMEFLYLSDSVCSSLQFRLKDNTRTDADAWLKELDERICGLNPRHKNMVFGYDAVDNDFTAAWNALEKHDLYRALEITFDVKLKEDCFSRYYAKKWFPYVENRFRDELLKTDYGTELFCRGVDELSLYVKTSNLDQTRLIYIFDMYREAAESLLAVKRRSYVLCNAVYKLYDAGIAAYNHIGDSDKALECYKMCREYAGVAGTDAFISTTQRTVVSLEDNFEWDAAEQLSDEIIGYQELTREIKNEILGTSDDEADLGRAKALSQHARILAEKHSDKAEGEFRKALDICPENNRANYKITQSYLLHLYCDRRMKAQYEEEAKDYFDGRTGYAGQLDYIINMHESGDSVFSTEYALYVLIRSIYVFGGKNTIVGDDELWNKLCGMFDLLSEKNNRKPGDHPWEIIYKYMEIFAEWRGDTKQAKLFNELKKSSITQKGNMVNALMMFGDAETADAAGDIAERDRKTLALGRFLNKHFSRMKTEVFSGDGDERYKQMEKWFTFMYR